MMRINYDTATVNISVVNEQRNISFQNDISLKTMRVGVLSWEKLKNRETHGRIVSLDHMWTSFVIIAWTSKKASKVQKILFKVGHGANLKHSKSTWRQLIVLWKVQNHINIKSSGHKGRSPLLDRGTGTIDMRQLSFWYTEPTNYEDVYTWVTHLHIVLPTITCSLRYA